jgi:hypothetical protein
MFNKEMKMITAKIVNGTPNLFAVSVKDDKGNFFSIETSTKEGAKAIAGALNTFGNRILATDGVLRRNAR